MLFNIKGFSISTPAGRITDQYTIQQQPGGQYAAYHNGAMLATPFQNRRYCELFVLDQYKLQKNRGDKYNYNFSIQYTKQ